MIMYKFGMISECHFFPQVVNGNQIVLEISVGGGIASLTHFEIQGRNNLVTSENWWINGPGQPPKIKSSSSILEKLAVLSSTTPASTYLGVWLEWVWFAVRNNDLRAK